MTNTTVSNTTVSKRAGANKKESKLEAFFREDNPKTLMILNGFTAFIWTLCTVMKLRSIFTYNLNTGASLYITGGLALFYLGLTLGYACKYAKAKKLERGEML